MKKALLFFLFLFCIVFTYTNRYQPVSLELVQPTLKTVEIKGEVKKPGVYEVKWDATVKDVIQEAGGLLEQADTKGVSLVENVEPDSTVLIPSIEKAKTLISINSASLEDLCRLKGVGPALAKRIIDYRSVNPFDTLEEIMQVKGIGEKMLEKIRDQITL